MKIFYVFLFRVIIIVIIIVVVVVVVVVIFRVFFCSWFIIRNISLFWDCQRQSGLSNWCQKSASSTSRDTRGRDLDRRPWLGERDHWSHRAAATDRRVKQQVIDETLKVAAYKCAEVLATLRLIVFHNQLNLIDWSLTNGLLFVPPMHHGAALHIALRSSVCPPCNSKTVAYRKSKSGENIRYVTCNRQRNSEAVKSKVDVTGLQKA